MIATNTNTYGTRNQSYWGRRESYREYSEQEVHDIINSGSLLEQQKLSRNYFNKEGYYKQIITHYATILNYAGLLIPNPSVGKDLSTPHIQKKYYSAMDYVEHMHLPVFLTNCALRALIDGAYYGVLSEIDKHLFVTIDLPAEYCVTRFKDAEGNDIIEFNLAYFNSISDTEQRKMALAAYPKEFAKAYRDWSKGRRASQWFIVPSEVGICFPLFDGRPPFASIIPATIAYDDAVATNRERDKEEIRKIIVQKIPHLSDGRLLFEPDEAEEIHTGTVGMLKGNENVSVLTTYADVEAITSKTSAESTDSSTLTMQNNIYAQGGTSSQIFNAEGSVGLDAGIRNNIAFMMMFANKAALYITSLINRKFANTNINFKYTIFPISQHNYDKFLDNTFKLTNSGYSFLLPSLALGLTQRDLGNLKDLENNVLKLGEKLIPPSTSYTQSASGKDGDETSEEDDSKIDDGTGTPVPLDKGGRPKKAQTEKAETTITTEESRK